MTFGVLVWTPARIEVVVGPRTTEHRLIVPADKRYWFGIDGRVPGRLYLRCPGPGSSYLVSSDQGHSFVAPPPLPAQAGEISPYSWKVHSTLAGLTALGSDVVWILDHDHGWRPRKLPADISVADVSFDRTGGLWCVGAAPSARIPDEQTEAAARYQSGPSTRFEVVSPRLGAADSLRIIRAGGLVALRTVDAEEAPVVATSLCSWFIDDESSFAFLLGDGHSAVKRLVDETVRMVDRSIPGCVRIFTCQAGLWQIRESTFQRRSLLPALAEALAVRGRAMIIRGMDADRGRLALVVEAAREGRTSTAAEPDFTAVCISNNDGESFEVARRQPFHDGAEILDVSWLR